MRGGVKINYIFLSIMYAHIMAWPNLHEVQENRSGGFTRWLTFVYGLFRWENYRLQTQAISFLDFQFFPSRAVSANKITTPRAAPLHKPSAQPRNVYSVRSGVRTTATLLSVVRGRIALYGK